MSLCSCFFLISCGGGGDGGGGDTLPTPTVAVTSDNAVTMASEIFQSASLVSDSAQFTQDIGQNFTVAVSTGQPKGIGIAEVIAWQMEKIGQNKGDLLSDSSSVVGVVIPSDPMPCDPSNPETSGTYNFSWNVSDINAFPSVGDSVSITYDNCSMSTDGSAGTINGSMNIKFNSIDLNNYTSFDVGVSFSNLQMDISGGTESINGDMRLKMNINDSTMSLTASGKSLSNSYNSTGVKTLSNYSLTYSTTYATSTTTNSFKGSLTSPQLNDGTVNFKTIVPFSLYSTDNYPSAGELEITGAKPDGAEFNSSLYVTVIDNTQVQIEIDTDGDGTYEITLPPVAWTQLDQQ